MDFLYADHDFIPEYKIEMAAGRTFQKEITTDTYDSFIINETASQAFGFESAAEAIGKQIYEGGSGNVAPIIGVTRDFHFKGKKDGMNSNWVKFSVTSSSMKILTVNTVLSFQPYCLAYCLFFIAEMASKLCLSNPSGIGDIFILRDARSGNISCFNKLPIHQDSHGQSCGLPQIRIIVVIWGRTML